MNAASSPLYTNEVSPEFLSHLDTSRLAERTPDTCNEHVLAIVKQRQEHIKAHPSIAIYRIAAQGSQTGNGGVIQHATSPMQFKLDNGQQVRAAQKGDYVVYADGTQAQIVTAAGEGNSHIALVGSLLSNGDQIINTPQNHTLLIAREGVPMAEDFLPSV